MEKKKRIKSRYVKLGICIFAAGAGLLLLYYLLYSTANVRNMAGTINDILTPFYLGIIMAYLLCPIYNGTLKLVYRYRKDRSKTPVRGYKTARFVASLVSFAVLVIVLAGFFMLIIPELINSVVGLVREAPAYIENITAWVENNIVENPALADLIEGRLENAYTMFLEWGQNNLLPGAETLLLRISEGILGTVGAVIDMLVAFIICLYVLNSKEIFLAQAKKIVLAVCSPGRASQLFEFADICHDTFGGFISGKIIDSIMVGILCFIAMSILGLPFALLISVVVGITDVIPFFGPFIGAVPSGVLLLFIDPWDAVKFALLILILQQIDGNIIAPKILGKTTRLASFWVLFAIIVGGGLFGLPGMILGVPTMAVIYIYFARLINNRLADRNLSTMTEVYENFEKYQINKEDIFGREACASDGKNGGAERTADKYRS